MTRSERLLAIAATVILISALAGPAPAQAGEIVLRQQFPVEGTELDLLVQGDDASPVAGAEVTAVYRPGSSVEASDVIGTTDRDGRLAWTPATAGIVTLSASWSDEAGEEVTSSVNVSVRFQSVPVSGVVILVVAGLLLVGGSAIRIRNVFVSG